MNAEFNGCINYGNISVENDSAEAHAAGIAGYVMKMKTIDTSVYKFIDCKNYGNISAKCTKASKPANVGGIVSTAHQGVFTIDNCENYGSISGESAASKCQTNVGGIIGRANSSTTTNNCSNNNGGNITATASIDGASAFAGAAIGYGDNTTGTINGFTNSGVIGSSTNTTKQLINDGVVLIGGIHTTGNWSYNESAD